MSDRPRQRAGRPSVRVVARAVLATMTIASLGCASTGIEQAAGQTRKGVQAADQGYWEEAGFRWLKALAIANLDARALNNLGVRSERAGEFEEAKEFYDKALDVASPAERFYVDRNQRQFAPIWERIQSGSTEAPERVEFDMPVDELPQGESADVGVLEVVVQVPDEGPNLAGYKRLLIGNFAPTENSQSNINDFAVRYMRRRITQRTFFETVDQIDQPLEPDRRGDRLLEPAQFWVDRASEAEADLVLTGSIGLNTRQDSQMVRERVRSPDGEIREVARFRDATIYHVVFDYVLLKGADGSVLLKGQVEAEQGFPVDDGIADAEAVFETLEQLLPQVLDAITPRRSEQTRYLIY